MEFGIFSDTIMGKIMIKYWLDVMKGSLCRRLVSYKTGAGRDRNGMGMGEITEMFGCKLIID